MRKTRWSSRMARAVKRGCFTRKDEELAENWTTCAVGERFGDLPDGDTELERIGMRFYRAVHRNQVAAAVKAYGEIQDRSDGQHFAQAVSETIGEKYRAS